MYLNAISGTLGVRTWRIQTDQGFIIVNTSHKWSEANPYISACPASPVSYLDDPKLGGNWKVVHKMTNRNTYKIPRVLEGDNQEVYQWINDEFYQERECVKRNVALVVESNVENSTLLCRDGATIAINELYVQLDGSITITCRMRAMMHTLMMKNSYLAMMIQALNIRGLWRRTITYKQ
jgi:hypothetical protein